MRGERSSQMGRYPTWKGRPNWSSRQVNRGRTGPWRTHSAKHPSYGRVTTFWPKWKPHGMATDSLAEASGQSAAVLRSLLLPAGLDLLIDPPVVEGLQDEQAEGGDEDDDEDGDDVFAVVNALRLELEFVVTLLAAVGVADLNVNVFGVVAALGAGLAEVHFPTRL